MKKCAAVFLALLFLLLVGCDSSNESSSNSDSDSDSTSSPGSGKTSLCNGKEWGLEGDFELDVINTEELSSLLTAVYIQYPSVWPSEYLPNNFPLYQGRGWMQLLTVILPTETMEQPETVEALSLNIYEYNEDDLDNYCQVLESNFFTRVPESEFSQEEKDSLTEGYFSKIIKYKNQNLTLMIFCNQDTLGDFIQLAFTFS